MISMDLDDEEVEQQDKVAGIQVVTSSGRRKRAFSTDKPTGTPNKPRIEHEDLVDEHDCPQYNFDQVFKKPEIPVVNCGTEDFYMELLDIQYDNKPKRWKVRADDDYDDTPRQYRGPQHWQSELPDQYSRSKDDELPVIRLFGRNAQGHSAAVSVCNFAPYGFMASNKFLAKVPAEQVCADLQQQMQLYAQEHAHRFGDPEDYREIRIRQVTHERHSDIQGFQFGRRKRVLKVEFYLPGDVQRFREWVHAHRPQGQLLRDNDNPQRVQTVDDVLFIRRPLKVCDYQVDPDVWECNVQFVLRMMIDRKLKPMTWLKIQRAQYQHLSAENTPYACSVDYHLVCDVLAITGLPDEGEFGRPSPKRIIGADIEVACTTGFPEPKYADWPIINIAFVLDSGHNNKANQPEWNRRKVAFCLRTAEPTSDPDTFTFWYQDQHEAQMLLDVQRFLNHVDWDVMMWYNGDGFDNPYIMNRARKLGLTDKQFHGNFSRIRDRAIRLNADTFTSKARGKRELFNVSCFGRLNVDLLRIAQIELKLRSYTLRALCDEAWKTLPESERPNKGDVPYQDICPFWNGDDHTRRELLKYCIRDAELLPMLAAKFGWLNLYMGMCRITGVPLQWLIERGAQIKMQSLVLTFCRQKGKIVPTPYYTPQEQIARQADDGKRGEKYAGATVLEAISAFYKVPIATLDFSSLYPSMMIACNLSPDTMLTLEQSKTLQQLTGRLDSVKYCEDVNAYWVASWYFVGIVPEMLDFVLEKRNEFKEAKSRCAELKDTDGVDQNEVRQLSCKLVANSSYGGFGAQLGPLTCVPLASSTTAFGRRAIAMTKNIVEGPLTCRLMTEFFSNCNELDKLQYALVELLKRSRQFAKDSTYDPFDGICPARLVPSVDWCKQVEDAQYWDKCEEWTDMDKLKSDICYLLRELPSGADVVYGDTDSVMIKYCGVDEVWVAMAIGNQSALEVTKIVQGHMGKPVNLLFEKVYFPMLLFKPKKYAGCWWEKPNGPTPELKKNTYKYIDYKGLELKRREHCPASQRTQKAVISQLLVKMDVEGGYQLVEQLYDQLMLDELPVSDYAINKGLSKAPEDYAAPDTQPQLWAKQRMDDEIPNSGPKVGSRMNLIIRYDPNLPCIAARATDPGQLERRGELVDRMYYWENKLTTPLTLVMDLALGKGETQRRIAAHRRQYVHKISQNGLARFPAIMNDKTI